MKRLAALALDMETRCGSSEPHDWTQDIAQDIDRMTAEFERVSEGLRAQLDKPSNRATG
jgi:hypothetical protein